MDSRNETSSMTLREYLLARGWEVDDDAEFYIRELPHTRPWINPVYDTKHDLDEAFSIQVQRDVEKLGGYEAFISLADATGRELEF